ncbi:MAG: cbb3-type cytochrome c oxidase subunit I [Burkholderiales bacterium]|nr:cbb3-type cytochrome c oxidase subunit I [Burkholderiales bacterium]
MNMIAALSRRAASRGARAYAYRLDVSDTARRPLAVGWLSLAVVSLLVSGLFSVLLVLSRAPYVKDFFPLVDFFHVALVVHVDLSVLVWFVAFGGVLWSLNSGPRWRRAGWCALALSACGAAIMAAAPFAGSGNPIMANYIPVLDEPVFLSGLIVFGIGTLCLVLRSMTAAPAVGIRPDGAGALRFGLNSAAVSLAVALIAFAWSWLVLPRGLDGRALYELLFWGGGHVMQFTYTLLMLVAWLWLAEEAGARVPLTPRVAILLFAIALVSVFLTPVIYLAYDIASVEHHRLLTWLMRFGGGLAIVPFTLAVFAALLRAPAPGRDTRPMRAALVASLILFGAGGIIGFMIQGSNVKIPAHYHGCIVGVTLALMGLTYALLPRLGFRSVNARLAHVQPWVYGGGQLLHIVGLVWSGGYGVQRKVAGADQALRTTEQIVAMGVMGAGGLIAVIGGVLFLIVVVSAMMRRHRSVRLTAADAA